MSKEERTGWRDADLSRRHRDWGLNCPAVDVDFLMVEYDHGAPRAIVEYKHKNAGTIDTNHPSYRALISLADNYSPGPLPLLVAFYDPDTWVFVVQPINEAAKKHYKHCAERPLSEKRFVKGLYLLRKPQLSQKEENIIAALNDLPQEV